jgi:hypothetical protein
MKVDELFNLVLEKAKNERKKNKDFDGKEFWQPIKAILDKVEIKFEWKKLDEKKVKEIMDLPEYYKNGNNEEKIIEKNHFIIQSVRIPTKEEASLKKLIQIALNIGQYEGTKENNNKKLPYDKINSYVSKNISNIELEKHMNKENINKLNKYVSNSIGKKNLGNYLEKNNMNKLKNLVK